MGVESARLQRDTTIAPTPHIPLESDLHVIRNGIKPIKVFVP